jgi:hypothetical protein
MRPAPAWPRIDAMDTTAPTRRLILDTAIDRSVISGTLTAPSGERRDVHGWLELNTALEAMLATSPERPTNDCPAGQDDARK